MRRFKSINDAKKKDQRKVKDILWTFKVYAYANFKNDSMSTNFLRVIESN